MKKSAYLFTALLLTAAVLCSCRIGGSLGVSTGLCMITDKGDCLMIVEGSPIVLSDRSDGGTLFAGLDSGDRIRVTHDGIQETYPARTGAYRLTKLSDGTVADLPESVLAALAELGWYPRETLQPGGAVTGQPFNTTVSWANYGDENLLWSRALNRDKAGISEAAHLPILRFDSAQALATFKTEIGGEFTTQQGWDEVPSFEAVTADMDEDFFASHSLFVVYVWSGSCSWRYGVNRVDLENGGLTIHVQRTDGREVGDCAMAGWFITVSVPKEQLQGITSFDAALGSVMA